MALLFWMLDSSKTGLTKIVNVYNVYDLAAWPRNPANKFKFKNCLFGATVIVKVVIKKTMCTGDFPSTLSYHPFCLPNWGCKRSKDFSDVEDIKKSAGGLQSVVQ